MESQLTNQKHPFGTDIKRLRTGVATAKSTAESYAKGFMLSASFWVGI
jgi:hypothetical protein